ncbi:hypothetical protein ASPBRDRAFT_44516 [Aspergillus brasiliensis CBS 101740]|uniref:Ig-like domain-containing protein n=1 Tax=Aspergillus brasiliensis (strain CBS 101740 / IMI 381727 / IBT 21946) TaxID=767769 RepID=A0A1L9UFC1_ASPBC|nr:hypothetical protein ASPBRDRAFT_44516 [Aspergillus brasiliensis CBS 101740]
MSLLMRVPVPSLLSGLFVLSPLPLVETKVVETWPHLVGHDIQENWFSTEVAHRDWKSSSVNSLWLSRSSHYATPPVSISLGDGDGLSTLTLMNQSVYWSNMSCRDVTVTGATPSVIPSLSSATNVTGKYIFQWSLRNITLPEAGQVSECTLNIDIDCLIPSSGGRFQARYWEPTQSNSTSRIRSAIHANNCPLAGLYGLVIDMESSASSPLQSNVTAFACEVINQQAIANVSLTSKFTVSGVDIMPSTVRDLTQQQFSAAGLQRLVASRHNVLEDQQTSGSLLSAAATNTTMQAEQSRVVVWDSDILGLPQYQERIGNLWNNAFITAVDSFFDVAANETRIEARLIMAAVSIQVVSHAAIIVETILVLALALLLALSWIYPHRPSLLHEDPGTIAAQCSYIARLISPETLQALSRPVYHVARTHNLQHWAREFWCGWKDGHSGGLLDVYGKDGTHLLECPHAGPQTVRRGRAQDPMPHFLTIPWFLVECMLLIGTVAAFGLAFKYMQFKDLKTFSSTEVTISALFLVYGPTVFSSMINSLFTSIHRHLSAAEPWIRLRKGPAPPEVLLTSSHSPLTTLVVSLRSGTRVSGAVMASSVVCLLNLVLIVASGGLFEPQIDKYFASISLTESYNSSLFLTHGLELDFEGYDSTLYDVSSHSASVPWTTADFSYLPLENSELGASGSQALYTSSTRGIGVSLNCEAIPHEVTDYTSQRVNVTYTPFASPANTSCTVNLPQDVDDRSRDTPQIHYIWPDDTEPLCQQSTFSVFVSRTGNASSLSNRQNFTALHCEPRINIQDFNIDFDTDGVIQRHEAIPGSSITSGPFFHNASKALGYFNQGLGRYMGYLRSHGTLAFYQSSFPGHLTTEIYKKANNGSTELDNDSLIHAVQSVYQTAFSHYLSLRRYQYLVRPSPNTTAVVNGTATYPMWGFMPAKGSMITIMLLISVDILLLLSIFALYHGRYDAPRIPKSLGSLIPWVASSSLLKDIQNTRASIDKQKEDVPGNEGQKYHFRSSFDSDGNVIWVLDMIKAPT